MRRGGARGAWGRGAGQWPVGDPGAGAAAENRDFGRYPHSAPPGRMSADRLLGAGPWPRAALGGAGGAGAEWGGRGWPGAGGGRHSARAGG